VGSLQVSKALDRTRKLHGYRINAYVRLGVKSMVLTSNRELVSQALARAKMLLHLSRR
jgi:hypothetical protein